ncbi:MAG TPA: preprotein translocase subunit SecE [Armatimonadota bacterium]|nr:preprotein translocase subunit SecE [Armatimonadota bacterium]
MATMIKKKNVVGNTSRFLQEVWSELKKVQWPNREELKGFTIMVIVAIVAVGAYIGLLDVIFARASDWIFQLKR